MSTKRIRLAIVTLTTAGFITGSALAQEPSSDIGWAADGTVTSLPPQREDLGHLVPLHAASVMSWLCGDTTVQTALGTSREGCYREIYPSVTACTAELQGKTPARGNRAEGGRLDVLSFRAAFRTCLQQDYVQRLSQRGRPAPPFGPGQADPLAARMGVR